MWPISRLYSHMWPSGIWLARSDLVFNGRARIWDKIFLSHFASIGFVAAIKE